MLVDLTLRGRLVLVIGTGAAAQARAATVTAEGARVVRVGATRAGGRPARSGRRARNADPQEGLTALLRRVRPWAVFSTLNDPKRNRAIAASAHSIGALVHVYDAPRLSDLTLPSVGSAGAIRLAVSTSGRSPAMAGVLRRRLEKAIRPQDVLQVRLQGRLRRTLLRRIPTFEARREFIYRLLRDREIGGLLRARRFDRALAVARRRIASEGSAQGKSSRKASR